MGEGVNMNIGELILKLVKENSSAETVDYSNTFTDLAVNSIEFIKIIVGIETNLDIEFEDEYLNIQRFEAVADMVQYVEEIKQRNVEI
jgi:acyl carrier protein